MLINKPDQKEQDLKSKEINKTESINSAMIKSVVNKNQMTSTSFRIDDIINNNKSSCENSNSGNETITNSLQHQQQQQRYSNSFMSTLSSMYDSSCFFPPHSINKAALTNQQSLMPLIYNSNIYFLSFKFLSFFNN